MSVIKLGEFMLESGGYVLFAGSDDRGPLVVRANDLLWENWKAECWWGDPVDRCDHALGLLAARLAEGPLLEPGRMVTIDR